jgi:phosphatidate cytidylyltransferase
VAAPASGNLAKRVASAAILAPLGLLALFIGGPLWDAVIALAAAGVAFEWSAICQRARAARAALIALSVVVTLAGALGQLRAAFAILALGMALLLAWRRGGSALSCGAAYVALPSLALVWLRAQPAGLAVVLMVMLTVWASDTGAYVAGRALGGPKLAPRISPSKTWSGAAGGLLAACVVGTLFGLDGRVLHPLPSGPAGAGLIAGLLGLTAQAGDLAESAAKRRFGVKDSGRLIPGHGGLLDRLDGLMAAAPAAAILLLVA